MTNASFRTDRKGCLHKEYLILTKFLFFFWSLWDIELYTGICCFHALLTDNTPIFFQEISFSFESSWPWILVYSSPKKRISPSTSRWTQMKNWTKITSTSVTSTGNFCIHAVFTSSKCATHVTVCYHIWLWDWKGYTLHTLYTKSELRCKILVNFDKCT